ncbi:MAG: histidine phosphatase family protein [Bradyrhizobium sp.]|uniref:histidine phosphatase family protein n=1 Tax=Bradyrhizobium sp. TaxID=376 RepID=UPI001C2A04B7|nr:histidine phosphatase family protein [Bradyrhizobium sp.]MBU6464111.1 phosphoglycerate mutase family protein [Pseudomonadota bacterium]MDE2068690.1 histidine phosphatase family protein [Bradyrhizobium sp.]MDE2470625.1 histidine phosphatase family protein [Bradyrhizobium sp.]
MRSTIYYIRHGQTGWNVEGRFQGSKDIPLNQFGRSQAAASGEILGRLLAQDGRLASALPFVSSPLGRARSTMELVRGALKLPVAEYAIDERLREIGFGHWEGLTVPEMQANDAVTFAARAVNKWSVAAPAGESYASVTLRVRAWFDSVTTDTVTVAHGGTMRALMVALGLATELEAVESRIGQGVVYVFRDGGLQKYS